MWCKRCQSQHHPGIIEGWIFTELRSTGAKWIPLSQEHYSRQERNLVSAKICPPGTAARSRPAGSSVFLLRRDILHQKSYSQSAQGIPRAIPTTRMFRVILTFDGEMRPEAPDATGGVIDTIFTGCSPNWMGKSRSDP
jgi:hypothetical protein